MKRDKMRVAGGILLAGVVMGILSACGGSTGGTSASPATPQPPAASQPTHAPEPVTTITPVTPAATSTQSSPPPPASVLPTVNVSNDDLVAKGKLIFEKTAGGMGCASCHGMDAKGASAPYIRNVSKPQVRQALAGVLAMSFIKLNDDEITAVFAYLQYLSEQP